MAEGDIGSVIDSLVFDAVRGTTPRIIHVSGNVYAIVYDGDGNDGFLATVTIAANGTISNAVIDSWEYDTVNGTVPDIIHISDDVYAIAYSGNLNHGWLKTVTIAADGTITKSFIDTLEFEITFHSTPKITHISGVVYAIVYEGAGNDGFLATVTIAANGAISNAVLDSWEYDTANGKVPSVLHISGNVYAIAYQGTGSDGFLVTVTIATDGTITKSVIDTLEFGPADCFATRLIHVSDGVYAIAYCGGGFDGFLATVTIAADGTISNAVIDSWEYDTVSGWFPKIIHVSSNVYAVAYQGTGGDGFLVTVTIAANGTITKSFIDSLEFDLTSCAGPDMIHISGNVYAIAYEGEASVGKLKTVDIETVPEGRIDHLMLMGIA